MERAHVDHNTRICLVLPVCAVALAPRRNVDLMLPRILNHRYDVIHGSRLEYCDWAAMHDVRKIVRRCCKRRVIGNQPAIRGGQATRGGILAYLVCSKPTPSAGVKGGYYGGLR